MYGALCCMHQTLNVEFKTAKVTAFTLTMAAICYSRATRTAENENTSAALLRGNIMGKRSKSREKTSDQVSRSEARRVGKGGQR